jgi:hypothetical protein
MIKEKVMDKLKEGNWTFADISNIEKLVNDISQYLYSTMDAKEKLDLIWDKDAHHVKWDNEYPLTMGQLFQESVMMVLDEEVASIIRVQLESAKVNFNKDSDENEISKRSMGRKPLKERTTDEASNSKK